MKIARANQKDFDRLWSVYRMMQMIGTDRPWNEGWNENTSIRLQRILTVILGRLEYESGLMRIVMGFQALIDSGVIDKDSDALDLHPDINRALDCSELKPIDEHHEEIGDVLLWKIPIVEPPVVDNPSNPSNEYTPDYYSHYSLLPVVDVAGLEREL